MVSLAAFSAIFSMMAFAESWSGSLIDAGCFDQTQKTTGCDATSSTKSFALAVSGKVYKLDSAGNIKASTAVKNRADRAADPAKSTSSQVMATVEGTETNGIITTDSVDVR
jgi:hypothetical protein